MQRYQVRVSRTAPQFAIFEIEAESASQVTTEALVQACNTDFHDGGTGEAEYDIEDVSLMKT